MKWLKNKANPVKAIWVAENENDVQFAWYLFSQKIYSLGIHTLWFKNKSGIGETDDMIQNILKLYPNAQAIAYLEMPQPFNYTKLPI